MNIRFRHIMFRRKRYKKNFDIKRNRQKVQEKL